MNQIQTSTIQIKDLDLDLDLIITLFLYYQYVTLATIIRIMSFFIQMLHLIHIEMNIFPVNHSKTPLTYMQLKH